ncbi:MAG: hypothetical protein LBI72_06120 [Flavobacteriaceae bacterium]|jgi:hypothetical protein|nr:hypothetical protein [Flavobacteriaceae bacterium]
MGWFTEKPISWELKKGWVILFCIVFPVFTFIGIWYMGTYAKIGKMKRGLISVGIFFVLVFLYMCFIAYVWKGPVNGYLHISDFIGMVLVSSFLVYSMTLITANTKEFLERIHLSEFIELDWVEYDYLVFLRSMKVSKVQTIPDFVEELKSWDHLIEDEQVSSQVVNLIELLNQVDKLKKGQTELFMERHVYSLTSLLRQFHEVELSKLNYTVISRVKDKLRSTFDIAIDAIKQEILDDLKQQNKFVEVEADVYIQSLYNEGLL